VTGRELLRALSSLDSTKLDCEVKVLDSSGEILDVNEVTHDLATDDRDATIWLKAELEE